MGDRWRPKSDGGVRPPERTEQGVEALEAYGVGAKDPLTGLYESYEAPPGKLAASVEPPPWADLFEQWPLIEWDFTHHLNLDASKAIRAESFRWFTIRLMGLLSLNGTALHGYFRRDETPDQQDFDVPN